MDIIYILLFTSNFLLLSSKFSCAIDTITSSTSISDGNTIVSKDGTFELGFFSLGTSSDRYVGIWYKNIPVKTVVWVLNRCNPINDSSGLLMIDDKGNLSLVGDKNKVVWSSNVKKESQSPIVQLLDSGNLVLWDERDGNDGNYMWQSFDYPSDTLVEGMKFGVNLKTGLDRHLTAWKNWDDPSPADFVWKIQPHNYPELVMWKGSKIYFRNGPWNGISFTGSPHLLPNPIYNFSFVHNEEEVYYIFYLKQKSVISKAALNETTSRHERTTWDEESQSWKVILYTPTDICDMYHYCGPNGVCLFDGYAVCQCLKGFKPKSPGQWSLMNWTQGCVPNNSLNCRDDGFIKLNGLKLPDTTYSWVNKKMNLEECRAECLQNCSCTAYTNLDISGEGSGCAMWFNDLIDIRKYSSGGQDLHIRISASELVDLEDAKAESKKKIVAIIVIVIVTSLVSGILVVCYFFRIRTKVKDKGENKSENDNNNITEEEMELPVFDLTTIVNATENFSIRNKLGEGGFGPVYKGTMVDGQEIAVKRLSRNSGQGLKEFKNEVILIAKLQHRNLVKLLGCCIEGEERMLIYEYMPNKSLDSFIFGLDPSNPDKFDQRRGKLLDWGKRLNIIHGIARGLLYLHQDSRLRIIHRDLKTSNVLLDNDLNPKISDFGMAKTFGGDRSEGNTNRVVGTYGYMAPEYATDGLFSVKSDVFSFGILMLEIISGKKSRGFYHPNHSLNLIAYAWILWKEGKALELVDTLLGESCDLSEVIRCIQISLLCVQQHPEDRPSMASVILMLGSEIALRQPKEPGFFKDRCPFEAELSTSKLEPSSAGEMTMSLLEAR